MKSSIYTTVLNNGDQFIIYNSLHDKILLCSPEIIDLLRNHKDIDAIKDIHPSLYKRLCDDMFIVPEDKNEVQDVIDSIIEESDSDTHYSITINPTMNCNLRCWYCYEDHLPNSNMSKEIVERIKKLIAQICNNGKTKSIYLSFFGGEPLLGFERCIKPLILDALFLCNNHNIRLALGFTTNAVLLDTKTVDFLSGTGLNVSFQIPFDGGPETHNAIKKLHNGNGTYDITLSNLKYVLSKGMSVIVRCNYTSETAKSFEKLVDDITPLYKQYGSLINFSFQRVWQDQPNEETNRIIEALEEKVNELGGNYYCANADKARCYADKRNSCVINYNGDVYQCTARKFTEENKEGYLREDGTIEYNERYNERMKSRFSNNECLECAVYPICKICTQKRMELDNTKCIYPTPDIDKFDMIRSRISAIYELNMRNKKRPYKEDKVTF